MNEILKNLQGDDFLEVMSASVSETVLALEHAGLDFFEIGQSMESSPAIGLATKGGTSWRHGIWGSVLMEVHLLLCTSDEKYRDLRQKLRDIDSPTAFVLTTMLATKLAATIGMAASVLIPFVALVLRAVCMVGLEAWCATRRSPPRPSGQPDVIGAEDTLENPVLGDECQQEDG